MTIFYGISLISGNSTDFKTKLLSFIFCPKKAVILAFFIQN